MAVSVSLSNLSCSAPDRARLFTELNLTFGPGRTGLVGRNGTGKSTLLALIAGDLIPSAGQIHRTGTVARMRQGIAERPGDTITDLFGIGPALAFLERAGSGSGSAEDLAQADWTLPQRVQEALARCGVDAAPDTPLSALSGGQRSRAALAGVILAAPDILLLDEPTNNLDRSGRRMVIDLIRGWKGGAIIASHDRELLEEMDDIVELSALGAARYGGHYSAFRQRKDAEAAAAERDLADAEKTRAEAALRARIAAERKARKDAAGHRSRARRDQPKVLMDAARGRAEASGGAGVRLRDARRAAAEEALQAARDRIEILHPLAMDVPRRVLHREGRCFGWTE